MISRISAKEESVLNKFIKDPFVNYILFNISLIWEIPILKVIVFNCC